MIEGRADIPAEALGFPGLAELAECISDSTWQLMFSSTFTQVTTPSMGLPRSLSLRVSV